VIGDEPTDHPGVRKRLQNEQRDPGPGHQRRFRRWNRKA
jgi:hypothetical protein